MAGLGVDLRRRAREPAARGHALPAGNPVRDRQARSAPARGRAARHDGLYACSGIVYNHESERRPERFVTRRITRGAAAIALGLQQELMLGDLDAVRDWSFAGDIMRGAWMMLQQDDPEDYVLASGVARTVAELARTAFACVDLDAERYLRVDPALVRSPDRTPSVGDPTKARERLGLGAAGLLRGAGRAHGAGRPALARRAWPPVPERRSHVSVRSAAANAYTGGTDGHRRHHRAGLRRPAARRRLRAGGLRRHRCRRRLRARSRRSRRATPTSRMSPRSCCERSPGASTPRLATPGWPRPTRS